MQNGFGALISYFVVLGPSPELNTSGLQAAAEVTSQAKVTFTVAVLLTVAGIFAYKKYWKGAANRD